MCVCIPPALFVPVVALEGRCNALYGEWLGLLSIYTYLSIFLSIYMLLARRELSLLD